MPTTKIRPLNLRIGEKIGRGVREDDSADLHDIAAVGQFQGRLGILLHQDDRDPGFVDFLHSLEDGFDQNRGQTQTRLVQEQNRGIGHEGPTDGQHLLLPPLRVPASCLRRSSRRGKSS